MSKQDFITATSPLLFAENGALNRVLEKGKNKQAKELRHLGALVQMLERDIANAKSRAKDPKEVQSSATQGSNFASTKFERAMADMAMALQMLQVMISKFSEERNNQNYQIAQGEVKLAQENLNKIQNEITKIHDEEEKAKTASFWEKFASVFVTAVVDVVAIAAGQPEIAILATTMCALSMSGAFKSASKGLAHVLEDCGMGKEAANITAAVAVTLAVIAVTYSLAPASAGSSVANAVEDAPEGVEMVTMSASQAEEEADVTASSEAEEAEATSSSSMASKLKSGLSKINLFNRLSLSTNMMIINGMQAIMATGLMTDISNAVAKDMKYNEKEKEELQLKLTIAMAIVMTGVCLGSGSAMAGDMNSASEFNTATRYGRFMSQLQEMTANSKILSGIETARKLGLFVQAGSGIAEGAYELDQGVRQKAMGGYEADFSLVETAERLNAQETKQSQTAEVNTMQQQKIDNASIMNLMSGEAAIANILDTPV